jgi:hypothetical protein
MIREQVVFADHFCLRSSGPMAAVRGGGGNGELLLFNETFELLKVFSYSKLLP